MAQTDLTTYGFAIPMAVPGQLYDITDNTVDSLTATGDTPFGAPIAGDTDETGSVVNNVADKFVGVALHTHARENNGVSEGYRATDRMSVLRRGRVWVIPAVNVVKEDLAYVTATGTYTNVASTNSLVGRFLRSASAAGLTVLEVGRPLVA